MATATAEKQESTNKVTITDAGPCTKKIAIEIPAQTVAEQVGTSLDTVLSETELPGFRKGRAPRRLVEKRFGSTVRREAKNQLVAQAYSKAIEDHKLRVVGEPASEKLAEIEIIDGKPLAFEVEVEVLPEFDLPGLDGIAVLKPNLEVTDEMVGKEVDRLLLNEGTLEPKEKPEKGDYLTGHATMKDKDGKAILDIQDAVIQVPGAGKEGKGMILGVMVEDFADQIGAPKVGSQVTIKTTGPENHENEDVRGKDLVITFTPKRADQIIPAKIEDLVERYGMGSADDLRKAVRDRIDQRLNVEQQSLMRQQIAKHLLDGTKMELPKRATAAQAARNLERRRLDLMYRGVDVQRIEEHMAELRAASGEVAVRELKLFFVLDKAAESMDIKVSDAEINGRIAAIAQQRNERPEKLRQEIINRGQVGMVYNQIREHKTMDAILAKAKVSEVSVEEFNKAMKAAGGEQAETGDGDKSESTSRGKSKK
ncbi:MAG: trigger factor [Phycisphaerales bacterium]|nr:trigger factor [Phycisphaerales bacterium]